MNAVAWAREAEGISEATLRRAKEVLPIRATRNLGATTGYNWKWLAEESP